MNGWINQLEKKKINKWMNKFDEFVWAMATSYECKKKKRALKK